MDSRSLSFGDEIMAATGGQGIDVVVNSLAGDAMRRGLSILAPGGRFLELGKRDLLEGGQIPLAALEESRAFFLIDLNSLAERRPDFCGQLLGEAMALFEDRAMAPIPKRVFGARDIGDALHFMGRGLHIGKVVVRVEGAEVDVAAPTRAADLIRDDGAYVITGGLGGIALLIGRWLVTHGARHLVLVGRRPPSAEALEAIGAMERDGARVTVDLVDVADAAAVREAGERWAAAGPPVCGIVHAAGVLDDGILLQQTAERFERVMAPKVAGAWNLHQATLGFPLDFFVLFSSAASMLGSAGQSNYAAANQFMDALAHHRRAHAQPALSLNWGPWSDIGLAARPDRGGRLAVAGMKSITPSDGMAAFARVLLSDQPQVGVLHADWTELQAAQPLFAGQPFFSRVARATAQFADTTTIRAQVLAAPAGQRVELLADRLREHAASVLRLPATKIDVDQPLITMGIDSLMAVELRSRVEKDVGVVIPLLQLVKGPSLSELARTLVASMTGTSVPEPAEEPAPAALAEKSLLLSLLAIKERGRS
jgi:acyl carrier protein